MTVTRGVQNQVHIMTGSSGLGYQLQIATDLSIKRTLHVPSVKIVVHGNSRRYGVEGKVDVYKRQPYRTLLL